MKVSGILLEMSETERVNKSGLMAACMKVIGETIKLTEEED